MTPCPYCDRRNGHSHSVVIDLGVMLVDGHVFPLAPAPAAPTPVARGKDWWLERARNEGDSPVGAGPVMCRGCGGPLLPGNWRVADGCPCNSPRGINHGVVPVATCTCVVCDPAQTGSTRYPAPPSQPPRSSAWDPVAHMEAVKAREASPTLAAIHRSSGDPLSSARVADPLSSVYRSSSDGEACGTCGGKGRCWLPVRGEWEPCPACTQPTPEEER